MNKEVTKKRMGGLLAIILSALMLAGIFSCFSVFADNESLTESTTDAADDNEGEDSSSVILRADELINRTPASHNTAVELVERDGISVVEFTITDETNDAMVYLDIKGFSASRYVVVLARADINDFTNFSVYYHTSDRGEEDQPLGEDARKASPYNLGNGWQFLEFDMKDEEGWGGSIYTFRLDYLESGDYAVGTKCEIAAIILSDDVEAIYDAAYELMTEIYTPVQTLSDFKESDIVHFDSKGVVNTQIEVSEGSLIYKYAEGPSNDPQAMFDYLGYTEANGIQALTTDDFRYTVVRYRAPAISDSTMELFTLTGNAETLIDMIRIEGTYTCHSAHTRYLGSNAWSAMVFDMAEDDGLEENTGLKYGWHREDGNRTFKGFRVDWCSNGFAGDYLEISDFMFYQDAVAANGITSALSSLIVGDDVFWGGTPEDPDESDETLGGDILPPSWETEETTAEDTTEETIPAYENTEDETTEAPSEETTAEITTEEESVPAESEDESKPEFTIDPDGMVGSDDEPKEKGSEVPFYIACGLLAALSVASIASVIIIRIREKRQAKTK